MSKRLEDRFMRHVLLIPESTCWHWLGYPNKGGYGNFRVGKQMLKAHRVSYNLFKGEIGDKDVLHSCDNPNCVNPKHLWLGTHSDNMNDMRDKKRGPKDILCIRKLSINDVLEIKSLYKTVSNVQLAKRYEVDTRTISSIGTGATWAREIRLYTAGDLDMAEALKEETAEQDAHMAELINEGK